MSCETGMGKAPRAHAGSGIRYGRRELRSVRDIGHLVNVPSPPNRRLLLVTGWLKGCACGCVRACAPLLPCCEMPDIGVLLLTFWWDTRAASHMWPRRNGRSVEGFGTLKRKIPEHIGPKRERASVVCRSCCFTRQSLLPHSWHLFASFSPFSPFSRLFLHLSKRLHTHTKTGYAHPLFPVRLLCLFHPFVQSACATAPLPNLQKSTKGKKNIWGRRWMSRMKERWKQSESFALAVQKPHG